ncbi:MAG: transglycosylase domain-containing protein, partial [Firmicutes bacterium]|nr:transglycosylase domain-containing protein [Bacillota bacterium]
MKPDESPARSLRTSDARHKATGNPQVKPKPDPGKLKKIFSISFTDMIIAGLAVLAFLLFVPVFTYVYFAKDLASSETIMNKNDTGIVLYDRYNRPFFTFYQGQPKDYISLSDIPRYTQQAIIAMEDKDFYSHPGFSVPAIIRAMWEDILNQNLAYGGSTLTQQLVKNSLLTPQKSFLRKYQEIVLAAEIERRYTKNQILEMYLNSVYLGEGSFGVEEAAKTYFNIPAKNLDLAQSSFLAALLPAPSALSPYHGDLNAAIERQQYILEKMAQQGYITPKQASEAAAEPLHFQPPADPINSKGIHFALMVRNELVKKYGEEQISRAGLQVKTTLDLSLQEFAEQAVADQVAKLAPDNVSNGAAVVIDPKTGEVLALVGSKNWYDTKDGKVNVATSLRQPGSSFKPVYYSAALDKGLITPVTVLQDVPTTFPGNYRPHDYDNKFRGPVTVRRALANSLNVPSVQVLSKLGITPALQQAENLGITTLGTDASKYGLSLGLGAGEVKLLELTDAYATFADNGEYNPTADILQITDKNSRTIYTYQPNPQQAVSPQASFLISSILSDSKTRAEEFGNTLDIPIPAAAKLFDSG